MFVRAIERLIPLRLRIPAHADRKRVGRIIDAFERREIQRKTLRRILLVRDAPSGHVDMGVPPRNPLAFFKCSSQRKISFHWPSSFCAMTARVMMVPGMLLFFVVFGTTFAARNCCFPFFARSPNRSTDVSVPSRACAPA